MKGIAVLLTLLLIATSAQAQLGGAGTPDVALPPVGGEGTGTSETPISDATAAATTTIENDTIKANVEAEAQAGNHVDWTFDLPPRGDTWRFRGPDGARDEVRITTHWRLGAESEPWPKGSTPTLHLFGDRQTIHRDADSIGESHATFIVTHDELVRGKATAWTLTFHLHDGIGWTSGYDGNRSSVATPAPGTSAAIHQTLWARDHDGDGRADDVDNCPRIPNKDQANLDGDVHGDACDDDVDGDGWQDREEVDAGSDRRDPKSTPIDRDGDGHNNVAEANAGSDPDNAASTPDDPDADGYDNDMEVAAGSDPFDAASTPSDPDADGLEEDNCPRHANANQADGDSDGIGDACDTNLSDGPTGDEDSDGVLNQDDNCPMHPNPDQANMDNDLRGDACDNDRDGDLHSNWADAFPDDRQEWADNDKDGVGDNADEDDDNDGLSDSAEIAAGTDPLEADSDGDQYSDLDELRMGSDALDPYDPPYLPTNVTAIGHADGTVTISWTSSNDPRIVGHTVWALEEMRRVESTDGDSVTDTAFTGGAATYAVQARFRDDDGAFRVQDSTLTVIFAEDIQVWQQESGGEEIAPANPSDEDAPAITPSQDSPGLGIVVLLGAILVLARRQR